MSRVLAIEIGMDKTKVCEASVSGKTPKIHKCIAFDTPVNAVEDGYIRDKENFEAVLKQELQKAGIKTKDVIYTVTSTKIATREVTIPPVKKDKIQQVIEANAQEYFPVDVGEYTISYSVLEKITTGEEKGWRLLALAVPDNLIKNYYNFSESMGFRLKNIDYMGNSALQVLKRQETGTINLSLMLNEETTMIYVIEHGILSLLRTIPYGSRNILEEVINRPVFEVENEREATELLEQEEILFSKVGQEWQRPEEDEAVEEAAASMAPEGAELFAARRGVTDSIDYLIGNLIRVVDFFHIRKEGKQIEKILLAGQGSKIKGLDQLISNETGLPVALVEHPEGINFGKAGEESGRNDYISCAGALIEPVKLKSKEQLAQKKRKSTLGGAKAILGLSAVLALVLAGVSMYQLQQEKEQEERLDASIEKLSSVQEIYEENARVQREHDEYKAAYEMTETETEKLSELFRELEAELPTTVMVDYLSLDGEQISLTMRAKTKLSVARLLMNLKEIDLLTEISVPSVTKGEDIMGGEVWNYSVSARFAGAVEKQLQEEGQAEEQETELEPELYEGGAAE